MAGIRKGQWAQEDALDNGEDGSGGADAEGEHEDCGDGEAGGFAELPQDESEIEQEILHVAPRRGSK
jgi:hypothetical protein